MAEHIVLDPSEVATGRTEIEITNWISEAGPDWGEASLVAYSAELEVGSTMVDTRWPNRQITIPLTIRDMGGTSFTTARAAIQAKAGIMQQQGGWLKRVTASGGTVFADIINATLTLGGDWMQANRSVDTNAALTLEAIPDFYKAEETLGDHTETTNPEIVFTETTANGGDFPAGDRVRVVVDEDQAQNQAGLIWSFRGRNYNSSVLAASAYEAEALTPLDTATRVATVGASGGTVVTHGTLANYWLPVLRTDVTTSAGTLIHTGTNRVYARVYSASGVTVQTRFVYDVGDLVNPTENDPVRLYNGGTFHIVDLGEVRLDPTPTGTHRWQGEIQAKGDAGSESLSIDRVWIVNQDESAGVLRAPPAAISTNSAPVARDEFNQTAGNLDTPKAAQVGGNWAETGKTAGTAFVVETTGHTAQRTGTGDVDVNLGCYAYVGSAATTQAVQVDVKASVNLGLAVQRYGAIARFVDSSNCVFAVWEPGQDSGPGAIYGGATSAASGGIAVYKRVAGATTLLGGVTSGYFYATATYYRILITIDATGTWALYWNFAPNAASYLLRSGQDSVLATGGTLASGKPGIYDAHASASACTRNVDNFVSWSATPDAVAFASQSVELNTKGMIREDSAGAAYGPVSSVVGDLPRMPNRSSAGTVEFFAKASRGDLQTGADPGIDDISARIYRRASYLTVG